MCTQNSAQTIAIIIINVKVWCIILYRYTRFARIVCFGVLPLEVSFVVSFHANFTIRRVRACSWNTLRVRVVFGLIKLFCWIPESPIWFYTNYFYTHRPHFFPKCINSAEIVYYYIAQASSHTYSEYIHL